MSVTAYTDGCQEQKWRQKGEYMKEINSGNTELDVVGNQLLSGRQHGKVITYIFNLQVTAMVVGKKVNFRKTCPGLLANRAHLILV